MNSIEIILNFFRNVDAFTTTTLIIVLVLYNLFALILAFQIFTFNRLMTQTPFASLFRAIAVIHVAISFILLLLVIFAL